MALIQTVGRAFKLVYGSGTVTTFRVKFTTPYIKTPTGITRLFDQPVLVTAQDNEPYRAGGYDKTGALASGTSGGVPQSGLDQGSLTATPGSVFTNLTVADTNSVTAGTLIIAGTTVTLTSTDILTPTAVAAKIAATSISGYTVYANRDQVFLTNNTIGYTVPATMSLGTATQIQFYEISWTAGAAMPTNFDDIYIQGRTPVSIKVTGTGGTVGVQSAVGTLQDQLAGTLAYTAVTLTSGAATLTAPVNFVQVTNSGCTTITLYISR